MLVKVNHESQYMNDSEQKFWEHALSGDPLIKNYLTKQGMHGVDPRQKAMNQPVCPRCERFSFHHKQGIMCPSCGYEGTEKTKMRIYLKRGYYK